MTDKQINAKIAEACGWQHVTVNHHSTGMFQKGALVGTSPHTESTATIPSYTTDLNAMHEAEETLNDTTLFVIELGRACGRSKSGDHNFDLVHATARQRSEAFLRTRGKWIES